MHGPTARNPFAQPRGISDEVPLNSRALPPIRTRIDMPFSNPYAWRMMS